MNEAVHLQFRLGILHGLAQAKAVDALPESLVLADELEQKDVFFAPHAEVIRASYHGQRGEQDESIKHQKRGELVALRGGISWSSVTVMTLRATYMAMTMNDLLAIVRTIPELERLSEIAPKLMLVRDSASAFLELSRGHAERAIAMYEALLASPHARFMPAHVADRAGYARALFAAGRCEESRALCLDLLQGSAANEALGYRRVVVQQLAEVEATLGEHAAARARLEELLAQVAPSENPAWLGNVHRELARVALRERNMKAFDAHARACAGYYDATRNPALIQQVEQLHTEAAALLSPKVVPQALLNDELDELSTSYEADDERIAQLTNRRERADVSNDVEPPAKPSGHAHPSESDELDSDTLPPEKPLKQA